MIHIEVSFEHRRPMTLDLSDWHVMPWGDDSDEWSWCSCRRGCCAGWCLEYWNLLNLSRFGKAEWTNSNSEIRNQNCFQNLYDSTSRYKSSIGLPFQSLANRTFGIPVHTWQEVMAFSEEIALLMRCGSRCQDHNGLSGVGFWSNLFQQLAQKRGW